MGNVRAGVGPLLEEVGGDASRVAAAMSPGLVRRGGAAAGVHVVLHAEHVVRVVVMGDDRHAQHQYAEEQQEICGVPLGFHLALGLVDKDNTKK